jgi:predicted enzyme related to lactoylglutathione lyase
VQSVQSAVEHHGTDEKMYRRKIMSTFKVTGLRTLVLPVTNVEASTAFYKDVLGFEEDSATDGMVWLRIGGQQGIALLLHPIEKPEPVENGLVMELAVDNVDAAASAVASSAGRVMQQPVDREWGVREAVMVDPDGYRIWLVQPLS